MGESKKAGNFGIPATPRDGAPIEITGLLKSTLRWLSSLSPSPSSPFPFEGVSLSSSATLSYAQWDALVQRNFDKYYYIPERPTDDEHCILLFHFSFFWYC